MKTATVRLMNLSGVTGPVGTIECGDTMASLQKNALAWSKAQINHPWDVIVVEPKDGVCFAPFEIELV
jgi:hypothetical protein